MQEDLDQGDVGLDEEEYYDQTDGYVSHSDLIAAQQITFQDVMDHITGPVISIIAHVILLALLGTIVVFKPPPERKDIAVEVTEVDIKEMEKIPEPPEPPEEVQTEVEVEIDRPDVQTEAVDVTVEEVTVQDVQDIKMPDLLSVKPNNSALVMPGIMAMRSGSGRKAAIKRYGGSSATERSVEKGLRWLRDHQNADGSWGEGKPDTHPALTSLALLAFLAHGETPASAEFGNCVTKAIKKLVEYANKADGRGVVKGANYCHPMVSYALSEAYALTKIPSVEPAMNKCISVVVKGIHDDGGYDYKYKKGTRADTSLMGWNSQAMKAAFAGGCTVVNLEQGIEKVVAGFKSMQQKDGSFFYAREDGKFKQQRPIRMTPVSVLALQLLGHGRSSEAKKGLGWIQREEELNEMDWRKAAKYGSHDKGFGGWFLYTWYYQTQVYFQAYEGRGNKWKSWNKSFSKSLTREQESDGHWSSPTMKYCKEAKIVKEQYGETLKPFGTDMNVYIYSTSLCCLILEVYYRYLPTFKVSAHKAGADGDEGSADDDLGLVIE